MNITTRPLLRAAGFHFDSICRSDPTANKNTVTLVLHGPDDHDAASNWQQSHLSLAGARSTPSGPMSITAETAPFFNPSKTLHYGR